MILGLPRILDRLLFSRFLSDDKSWAAALVAALAVLVAVPMIANHRQSAQVAGLLAGDHDDLARPLPNQIYAVPSQQPTEDCTDFCQRLLLTGQATAVFVLHHDTPVLDVPDPATPGTLWQIKDQPTCPPVTMPVGGGRMQIKAEPGNNAPQADLLIGIGIAAGHCLIATASNLAAADTVIFDTTLRTQRYDPSFSLGADFIGAKRYAVWTKTNQELTEQARWTYVSAARMFPLAVPMADPRLSGRIYIGFPRTRAKSSTYDPGFDHFADQILGLRLSLMDVPNPVSANGEDPLIVALKTPGQLSANIQQLARGRIDAMASAQSITPEDRALFLALLADPCIDLKARYDEAARILLRDAPSDSAPAVAAVGFPRIKSILLPNMHLDSLSNQGRANVMVRARPIKAELGILGDVLAQLPDAALKPYATQIFDLARDRENRTES